MSCLRLLVAAGILLALSGCPCAEVADDGLPADPTETDEGNSPADSAETDDGGPPADNGDAGPDEDTGDDPEPPTPSGPTICAASVNVVRILGDLPGDFTQNGAFGHRIAVGDFDGDGQDDLVVRDRDGLYARIYRGPITADITRANRFLTLDYMDVYYYETDPEPRSRPVGDFDGDGRDEYLLHWCDSQQLVFGTATPGRLTQRDAGAILEVDGHLPDFTNVDDVNGDGVADLVTADDDELRVFFGPHTRDANLVPDLVFLGGPGRYGDGSLRIGDTDGDGVPNLVFTMNGPGDRPRRVCAVNGDTVGEIDDTLVDQVASTVVLNAGGQRFQLADLDGDGHLDIITNGYAYSGARIGVLEANSDWFVEVEVAGEVLRNRDWNGDGRDDLVTPAGVHFGRDTGVIAEAPDIEFCNDDPQIQGPISSVVVGDFNGNGVNDLAWAVERASPGGGVLILLDVATADPPADCVPQDPVSPDDGLPQGSELKATDFTGARVIAQRSDGVGNFAGVCDFDGDGVDDLVLRHGPQFQVHVFRGPLAGELGLADAFVTIDARALQEGCAGSDTPIFVGDDLNADGKDDIGLFVADCSTAYHIVLGTDAPGTIVLRPNAATEGVVRIETYVPGFAEPAPAIADVDGDGSADFLAPFHRDGFDGNHGLRVAHGPVVADRTLTDENADLVLSFYTYSPLRDGYLAFAVGDPDDRGVPGLIFAARNEPHTWDYSPGFTAMLPGDTTGALETGMEVATLVFDKWAPPLIRLADLNGDGQRDLLLHDVAVDAFETGFARLPKDGFVRVPARAVVTRTRDWNGDGLDDLVSAEGVHYGRSRGEIPERPDIRFVNDDAVLGGVIAVVTVGDFNGDGANDLVFGNPLSDDASGAVILFDAAAFDGR